MNDLQILEKKNYILRMTFPIFAQMLLMRLINNIDQIMLSRYSQDAVTAVGNANQLTWIMTIFLNVLASASIILVTQYKGSDDPEKQRQVYAIALAANVIVGAVVGGAFFIFTPQILTAMNVEQGAILENAIVYLRIISASVIIQSAVVCYGAFLRSNALLRQSLYVSLFANLFNIAGNALSLYVFDFGVAGVAISSVISQVISLVLSAYVFRRNVGRIEWELLHPLPKGELAKMLRLGVPSAGESMSYQVAQLVVLSFINILGSSMVNTKIYVTLIAGFAYMFCISLANATQVVVGWMLGARRVEDASRRALSSLAMGIGVTTALMLLMCIFSDQLLSIFTSDPEVLRLGRIILRIDLVLEIGRACNMTLVRALQTAGDVKYPTVQGILAAWLLTVPLAYFLGLHLGYGLVGVWIAMAADECTRGFLLLIRWKKGKWKKIDLVTTE